MAITPLMQLNLPTVQQTLGPLWASLLNTALTVIDEHDHTPGKGARITPTGINVNSDLDINFNDLLNVRSSRYQNQVAVLAEALDKNSVYVQGGNLFFNNDSGTPVQITTGGSLNAVGAGAITPLVPGAYPYTITISDAQKVLFVDTSTARTIILPPATTQVWFAIVDANGLANTNNITVTPNGADTIEGLNTSRVLKTNWGGWAFISNGTTAWKMV